MALIAAVEHQVGLFSLTGSAEQTVRKLARWTAEWRLDTAAATTAAIAEQVAHRVKQKSRLIGAVFLPAAAVTGAATNFFSLILAKRLGSNPATKSTLITYAADTATTDDAAAFGSKDLYVSTYITGGAAPDSTFDLLEGDVITLEVTKAASGMSFPISTTSLIFEARD